MKIKDLEQGSTSWLEVRRISVTSTDASIINGTNTFGGNCPYKLWQRKTGLLDEQPVNQAMTEGLELESEARHWFNDTHKVFMTPAVLFHDEHPWLMASLDGYSEELNYIVEIKCGVKSYETALEGKIPPYYYDQMQHALQVSGKDCCKYVCYRKDKEPIIMTVNKDEPHIKQLFIKEQEFYEHLIQMTPPPIKLENDYIMIDSTEANLVATKWKEAKEMLDIATLYEKECKALLLNETDDGSCLFPSAGVRVERINCKGTIDWKKVCVNWKIKEEELEIYRKQSIGYPRVSLIKPGI